MCKDTLHWLLAGQIHYRVELIPSNAPNRPGLIMRPTGITIHNTGNAAPGANADMHATYFKSGAGGRNVSVHYVVDDHYVIQLLPLNEVGWHAGDGPNGTGNRTTIAIEICENSDGNFERALDNAAYLVAALQYWLELHPNKVYPHRTWTNTACPHKLQGPDWAQFLRRCMEKRQLLLDGLISLGPWKARIPHPFLKTYLEHGDIRTFGYPLSDPFPLKEQGSTITVQPFERAVLEHHPEYDPSWSVVGRHVGREWYDRYRQGGSR